MPPLALIQHWMSLELPVDFNEEKQTNKQTKTPPISTPHHLFSGCSLHKILWKSVHVFLLPYHYYSAVATILEKVFLFQSQRKTMPKNAQTTAQLHSFHMLVK